MKTWKKFVSLVAFVLAVSSCSVSLCLVSRSVQFATSQKNSRQIDEKLPCEEILHDADTAVLNVARFVTSEMKQLTK